MKTILLFFYIWLIASIETDAMVAPLKDQVLLKIYKEKIDPSGFYGAKELIDQSKDKLIEITANLYLQDKAQVKINYIARIGLQVKNNPNNQYELNLIDALNKAIEDNRSKEIDFLLKKFPYNLKKNIKETYPGYAGHYFGTELKNSANTIQVALSNKKYQAAKTLIKNGFYSNYDSLITSILKLNEWDANKKLKLINYHMMYSGHVSRWDLENLHTLGDVKLEKWLTYDHPYPSYLKEKTPGKLIPRLCNKIFAALGLKYRWFPDSRTIDLNYKYCQNMAFKFFRNFEDQQYLFE